MDATRNDHPDEGTIHAWLDGAFDAPTAAAIEAHVASCPSCTERVAEARGLIAGASRVVSALDDVPSGVTPAWGRAPTAPGAIAPRTGAAGRRFRVTPARAAIAATILVALGVTLTRERTAPEAELKKSTVAAASTPAAAPVMPHDQLLDSAVKRNVDAASPPRTVAAAPGPNVSAPPTANQSPAVLQDTTASLRVGAAKGYLRVKADSAPVAADRLATTAAAAAGAPVSETDRREMAASQKAEALSARAPLRKDVPAPLAPTTTLAECYRVESANGTPASWGTVPLPFVVAIDSVGRSARVSSADGSSSDRASWTRTGDDSLTFQLRRTGYVGSLTLGAAGEVRAGVMRSAPAALPLSETAIAGGSATRDADKQSPTRRRAAQKAISPSAPAAAAVPENAAAPAVAVVARRVACTPAP